MDEIVLKAMQKWPHVPHCHGWLGLDDRGQWFLRDLDTQKAGAFPGAKGDKIEHAALAAFIGRNYACDSHGCWYFQNGPQRVYVELASAPWVLRLDAAGQVFTHTGQETLAQECLVDELGRAYLACAQGLGLVHSMDMDLLSEALEKSRWPVRYVLQEQLPIEFAYVLSPLARSLLIS